MAPVSFSIGDTVFIQGYFTPGTISEIQPPDAWDDHGITWFKIFHPGWGMRRMFQAHQLSLTPDGFDHPTEDEMKSKAKAIKTEKKVKAKVKKEPLPELTPDESAHIKKISSESKSVMEKAKELVRLAEVSFNFLKIKKPIQIELVAPDNRGVWIIGEAELLGEIYEVAKKYHEKRAASFSEEAQKLIAEISV